jgi:hypothetical protein
VSEYPPDGPRVLLESSDSGCRDLP